VLLKSINNYPCGMMCFYSKKSAMVRSYFSHYFFVGWSYLVSRYGMLGDQVYPSTPVLLAHENNVAVNLLFGVGQDVADCYAASYP